MQKIYIYHSIYDFCILIDETMFIFFEHVAPSSVLSLFFSFNIDTDFNHWYIIIGGLYEMALI
jgi:hypothetical protein